MPTGTTVVVIRDGRVIWHRFTPEPPLVPRKGTVMADTATTSTVAGGTAGAAVTAASVTEGQRWALLLQAKEKALAARDAVVSGSAKALAKSKEGLEFLQSTPAYSWFRRIFARALGMTRGVADMLGRTGTVALVVSVVLSRRGQQVIRWVATKLGNTTLSAAGYTVAGINRVLSWVPRKGKAWSDSFNASAMRVMAKVIGWSMSEHKLTRMATHLHHDAPVGHGLQVGATSFVLLKFGTTIIGGLHGLLWKVCSSIVLAVGMAAYAQRVHAFRGLGVLGVKVFNWVLRLNEKTDEIWEDATEAAEKIVDAPAGPEVKATVHHPNGTRLAGPAAHIAADVAADIAVERHQENNHKAGESAQRIGDRRILSSKGASLVIDTDTIARITCDFFDEETRYPNVEQLRNALKGRVYPIMKPHLSSKLTSKAARGFSVYMADKFAEGDGVYGRPGSDAELRETVASVALAWIDDPFGGFASGQNKQPASA